MALNESLNTLFIGLIAFLVAIFQFEIRCKREEIENAYYFCLLRIV